MTRFLVAFLVMVGCAVSGARASGQSLQSIFDSANQAFFAGDHQGAIDGYERLVESGVDDADVYYNLATAYARDDRLGHAILNYERALWRNPGDSPAKAGLRAAQDILANRRAERDGEAIMRTRPPISEALARPLPLDVLAWLVLLLSPLIFALLAVRSRLPSESARVGVAIALPLLGLLWIAAAAMLSIKAETFKRGRPAIVLHEGAALREGPDPRAQVRAEAIEGQSARLLEREGDHRRVRLPTGAVGWISSSDLGEIRAN